MKNEPLGKIMLAYKHFDGKINACGFNINEIEKEDLEKEVMQCAEALIMSIKYKNNMLSKSQNKRLERNMGNKI